MQMVFSSGSILIRTKIWLTAIFLFCAILCSCGPKSSSPVVASVNGEKITEADVDFLLARTFKESPKMQVDGALRKKIIESLITSRAMQQSMKKTMQTDELDTITRSVKAYEEELYVKAYLQKHINPNPVTAEQIQHYYDEHPEQFGAEYVRDFEMLNVPATLNDKQRDQLLAAIPGIRKSANWQNSAKNWQQDYSLQYLKGRSAEGLLDKNIEQALANLKKDETSEIFYVDGHLHLVRVINITQTPAKPVSEVSAEIRKKLAPLMLRDAVKKASDEVRSSAKVEFSTK